MFVCNDNQIGILSKKGLEKVMVHLSLYTNKINFIRTKVQNCYTKRTKL